MRPTQTIVNLLCCCVAAVAPFAAANAQASNTLTPFDATYSVKMKGLKGEMHMSLTRTEGVFEATSNITPRGIARLFARGTVEETAAFALDGTRLKPLRYVSSDTIARESRASRVDYDWSKQQATGANNDGAIEHPINASTYDRVSIQYALMLDLKNDITGRDYKMLDGKRLRDLDVRVVGESRIKVPFGEFSVIGIQHQARNSSRTTTLWCAKELGYLPVRIEQHRKGKRIVLAEMSGYTA